MDALAHEAPAAAARALATRLRGLVAAHSDAQTHERLLVVTALGRLVQDNALAQTAAMAADALPLLAATIRSMQSGVTPDAAHMQRTAAATTLLLVRGDAAAQDAAVRAGVPHALAAWLADGNVASVRILVLMALHALVAGRAAHGAALLETDVGHTLRRLARDTEGTERAHARSVLCALGDDAYSPGEHAELWSPVECARAVLTHSEETTQRDAMLTRLVHALQQQQQQHDAPPFVTLLVLEELYQLTQDEPQLATTAASVMETTVIPLCYARMCERKPAVYQPYAASVLMRLAEHSDALCVPIAGDLDVHAFIRQLAMRKYCAIFVLRGLVHADLSGATRGDAVAGGAIPLVVGVLRDGRANERASAARTLRHLVRDDAAAQLEALDADAMAVLVHGLSNSGGDSYVVTLALLYALKALLRGNALALDAFVDAGGAGAVAQLVASPAGAGLVANDAAVAINELASGHTRAQDAFTETGVVSWLVDLLADASSGLAAPAAAALSSLVDDHAGNADAILHGPALGRLVALLTHGSVYAQCNASLMIYFVAWGANAASAQSAVSAAGAIEPLVQFLQQGAPADDPSVRQLPAAALGRLVRRHRGNQRAVIKAGAVVPLLDMVRRDPTHNALEAAKALAYLIDMTPDVASDAAEATGSTGAELLAVLVRLLGSDSLPLADRSYAAQTLTDVAVNDHLQSAAVEAGALEALVALARVAGDDDTSRARCVSALTRLITSQSAARALSAGAVDVLVAACGSASPLQQQNDALAALLTVAKAPPPSQPAPALVQAGLLHALGRLVSHPKANDDAVLWAAALLYTLVSADKSVVAACWDAGVAEALARHVPHNRDEAFLACALVAIFQLAVDESTERRLADMLPLDVLLDGARSWTNHALRATAIAIALTLADNDEAQRARVVELGGLDVLVSVLRTSEPGPTRVALLFMLAVVASVSRANVDADVVALVRRLMDDAPEDDPDQAMNAAAALASLAAAQDDAVAWGVLAPVLTLLRRADDNMSRAAAAVSLASLVHQHTENQDAVARAGAIPLLADALHATSAAPDDAEVTRDAQRFAARALAELVRGHPGNARAVLVGTNAVARLVEMARSRALRAKDRVEVVRVLRFLLEGAVPTETGGTDEGVCLRAALLEAGAAEALEEVLLHADAAEGRCTREHAAAALACLRESAVVATFSEAQQAIRTAPV